MFITTIIKEINPEMDEVSLNEYSFIIRNLVIIISRSLVQLDLDDVTDIDILTTYVTAHKHAENRCKRLSKISDIEDERLIPAQLAPSAINSQPWYFKHTSDGFDVYQIKQNIFLF